MIQGKYISIDIGSVARLFLTVAGSEYLRTVAKIWPNIVEGHDVPEIIEWRESTAILWQKLFSGLPPEYNLEMLDADSDDYNDIGALTSAPVFAFGVRRNEAKRIVDYGRVFWFANYMVEDELQTLLFEKHVDFQPRFGRSDAGESMIHIIYKGQDA